MSDRLLVGTRKGLFTILRRSARWEIARVDFLADPVTMVLADPRSRHVHAALNLGHFGVKMRRSRDGGETWEESPPPSFPVAGEEDIEKKEGTEPPTVLQVWSLETGGADEPGVLWAGTIPGGLFRSRDHGETWHLNRPLWDRPERAQWFGGGYDHPGIHSVCVDPRDSRHVTVGVSCGGVWVTRDRGETWELKARGMFAEYMPPERREDPAIQDPHLVVQCPGSPDALWVQHHNGIFRSKDGAASWQHVTAATPSAFGFAVAVHPRDPETAWFVPAVKDDCRVPVDAKVVASRTRDGGASFETLCNGLPQDHAYDLVYRHSLDVDESGSRLAFGSTTGSLWVTEDGGDRWKAVSEHLPPIYCVRFA